MTPKSIILARRFAGNQEDYGPNDGAIIRTIRKELNLPDRPAPWCAAFVTWILGRTYAPAGPIGLKSWLRGEIGYRSPFFCDSCDEWLKQAQALKRITDKPNPGDLFVLVDSANHGHHIGFVTTEIDANHTFGTIEGNTNIDGSNEGNGVYDRARVANKSVRFIRLPNTLRG